MLLLQTPSLSPRAHSGNPDPGLVELEYAYLKHHPCLQWLPTNLAENIGENLQDELGFPDKLDAAKWSVAELNVCVPPKEA